MTDRELVAKARQWADQLDTSVHVKHTGAELVRQLCDALESAEQTIGNRSFIEQMQADPEGAARLQAAEDRMQKEYDDYIRADQMRRDADLLDELSAKYAGPEPTAAYVLRAAADRLRAQGGGA